MFISVVVVDVNARNVAIPQKGEQKVELDQRIKA
jgi:hypothetical protein